MTNTIRLLSRWLNWCVQPSTTLLHSTNNHDSSPQTVVSGEIERGPRGTGIPQWRSWYASQAPNNVAKEIVKAYRACFGVTYQFSRSTRDLERCRDRTNRLPGRAIPTAPAGVARFGTRKAESFANHDVGAADANTLSSFADG